MKIKKKHQDKQRAEYPNVIADYFAAFAEKLK
jgi:hypothetical protein